jgi:tetratricopeptide (TPR) repeat protein
VRAEADMRPLNSVRVDLKSGTGILVNTAYTRDDGGFEFLNLSSGEYFLEVELQGYEPYRESISLFNGPRTGFTVSLHKPVAVENINNSGQVSAHQLAAPRKARDYYDKGLNLFYDKSDYQGAIVQFERAIKEYPSYYEAYAQIGAAQIMLRDNNAAESTLRKSIEMSADQYADAFVPLAGLHNNMNRFSEAEDESRKGIALDASSWHGYYELARALTGLKQPQEAEKNALQAQNLRPDYPQIFLVLANIHIQERNYPALLQDLDSYLKISPTGPEADQARKTRDQLQAAMQKTQSQSPQAQPPK